MNDIKQEMERLFDERLLYVNQFKHKTYQRVFEDGCQEHQELLDAIVKICRETEDAELENLIESLARVIPDYAYGQLKDESKMKKERLSVDFNMNMAVYVIPMLRYSRDASCEKIAKRMVEIWNEIPVTSLTLSASSYEDISAGFKKSLCYITTAVCESRNLSDHCYELETLRAYRDQYLMQTEEGRGIVEDYYDVAPRIVMAIAMQEDSASVYEQLYREYLMPCIHMIEDGKNEECRRHYIAMVNDLQRTYLYA